METITDNYTRHIIEIKKLQEVYTKWINLHYDSITLTQGTLRKKGQKDHESQNTRKSVLCCKMVSPRNGCIYKTTTVAISTDMLMW